MSLVVFTGAVGFALAPAPMDWMKLLATLSAMAGGAGACGALNMWWDADIDANMSRTAMRPIPRGVVPPLEALAIGILPNVVGPVKTCPQIVAYSVLLVPASLGPMLIPGVGLLYGAVAVAANSGFLWRAFALYRLRDGDESARRKAAMGLFGFSILYLFVLFAAMLAEVILRGRV